MAKNKVLLIGWDAADWKVIHPLIDAGKMPTLKQFISEGVMGNLATLDPPLSPIMWTSIGTGKTADRIMENQEWDFLAVYYDAIDHYCHGFRNAHEITSATKPDRFWKPVRFDSTYREIISCTFLMKFHPPYREGIPRELYDFYNGVVESGYRFHDMMLERLLKLAGNDTTVIICSDHGFHPDHLRPLQLPKEPAGPAAEHSPYGMIAMRGPNIKPDELIYGSTLLDITPTVLTLFDLPTARDMDGRPLLQAFKQTPELKVIDSWEDVAGDCGMHAVDAKQDPWMEQEALDQLVALGYIEPPGDNVQKTVENNARESKYYLARVYLSKNDYADALPLLEELFAKYPDQSRFGLRLANVYLNLERIAEARRVTDATIAVSEQSQVQEIKDNFAQQKEKLEKEKAEPEKSEPKEPQEIPELPDDATLLEQIRQRNRPTLELLQGNLCLAEENPEKALEHFQKAQTASPRLPDLFMSIGHSYLKMQQLQDAEEAFFQSLEIDPDSAAALYGLGLVYLQMRQFNDAAEALMDAVGRIYHNPNAHYFLGEAFYRLGRFEMAAQSWEVAVTQAPGLKIITIVSGLPRSGTSMMMQILQAGGMDLLTDAKRIADVHNPKGYFELEAIKNLGKDKSCLALAQSKVIKVIAQLLPALDKGYHYRVIFMLRDMHEVLHSQQTMLDKAESENDKLAQTFQQQLHRIQVWLRKQNNIDAIYVKYKDVIQQPLPEIVKLNDFLEGLLDIQKCVEVVDVKLYRART